MKKNNKKNIFIVMTFTAVTLLVGYFYPNSNQKITKSASVDQDESRYLNLKPNSKPDVKSQSIISRKTASVASTVPIITKFKNRKIVGVFSKSKDFPISNKVNKDWHELAFNKLNPFKGKDTSLTIQAVKSVIYVKHGIGRYVEHVKIILKRKSGLTSSYDAYINSQTGAIMQTWNRTKFEIRKKLVLKSKGNEFYADKVNTSASSSL